jgi:peptide chain release factor subunit 1
MITAETIERVTRFDGGKLPVTSVYLGLRKDRRALRSLSTQASSLLHQIRPTAKDQSLDREVRLSVRGDIERIEAEAAPERQPFGRALAIFSCSGQEFYEEIELPRSVRDRVVVDATPWVRPMLTVLDEYHRTCVLVVDKESARTWELYAGEISETSSLSSALRTPQYAGWHGLEEYRVRNKAEEMAKRHFRRVATVLDDFFRAGRFELLAVGGHDFEVSTFVEFLPRNLREAIAGTFSIDLDTATTHDIRVSAEAIVERYETEEERGWVTDVYEKLAVGGNAVVGLEGCLWAGSVAAIQQLLVQEGATAAGVVCDESGWLAESGGTCGICGRPTRRTGDVIDELAEAVIDTGGTVEHVAADTPLTEDITAARLRFPLPPSSAPG